MKEQVKNLEELKKQGSADMQKVYEERINGLNSLQQEKQELYERRIEALQKKSNVNWVAVLIAVVLGLVIGYLIKGQ